MPHGIKGILKKNGYNYSEIIGKWNKLVGKNISEACFPKSIKMKKGETNGTLVIGVIRGNEIDIEYSKNEIINKINSFFGYKLISEIILQTINSKNQKKNEKKITYKFSLNFEKKIEEIKNENIKNSIFQLIDAVKK